MKHFLYFQIIIILVLLSCNKGISFKVVAKESPNKKPFPQHTKYKGDHIKPNKYTQGELDDHTRYFYNVWVKEYLKNDCKEDEYYIKYQTEKNTVSEAHGYGMMIMALMAGYETKAKTYFDGLYKYFKSHPSINHKNLMDWQQITCNDEASESDGSATDGDIDIAFALLLADHQWGSDSINYLEEAKNVIKAVMSKEINPETWTILLGDWSTSDNSNFYYSTRSSDFITSHFKSFFTVTKNANWDKVVDKVYALIGENQNTENGLMPDFIIKTNTSSKPAGPDFLEGEYDGDYYYNACRFPWRIGTDYLVSGDVRAQKAVNKLTKWIDTSTEGDPSMLSNGYELDGTAIYEWNNATFIAPFAVGAMADKDNQEWLNSLYGQLSPYDKLSTDSDYYTNTIKLLSMIVISGNYWSPYL